MIVACDKFKGSLTAAEVADAISAGVRAVLPDADVRAVPVADGGDGTLDAALQAGFDRFPLTVTGPVGNRVQSAYARRGDLAIVEMADCCGLLRLPDGVLQPMTASSRGLGEAIAATLDAGVSEIVVGVGGSASTDGGAGMLAALGARLLDAHGRGLPDGGGALDQLVTLDLSGLHPRIRDVRFVLATDVRNPLSGSDGAAAVFGPQKGATADQVADLDRYLRHFADLVAVATGREVRTAPGAGSAGGVGFAALAVLRATMRPGIEMVLEWSDFGSIVDGADLVVTGEGSLDRQTLLGKTPAGVAEVATNAGVPVVAVCGRSLLSSAEVAETAIAQVYALTDLEPDPEICMRDAAALLSRVAERVARDWLVAGGRPGFHSARMET